MSLHPQKMGKDIWFDILGLITEKLINDESSKEDPPLSIKDGDITKDKEEKLHEDDNHETSNQLPQDWTIAKDHPLNQILGDIKKGSLQTETIDVEVWCLLQMCSFTKMKEE